MRFSAAVLALAVAVPSAAQGLPDARTGQVLPQGHAAHVDDAFALDVNPAGLAFVDAFVFDGGYTGRLLSGEHDGRAALALSIFDGVAIGGGGGILLLPADLPVVHGAVGGAFRVGRVLSLGAAGRALQPLRPGGRTDLRLDLGTQLRPARFVALGAGVEDLFARTPTAPALRLGASFRPFAEWVTLGFDVRARPGSRDPTAAAFATGATVEPGASVRVDVGGFAATLGGSVGPAGIVAAGLPAWSAHLGVEVNAEHVGATLLGGAASTRGGAAGSVDPAGGAFVRVSGAEWPSVMPADRRWLKVALVGPGVPRDDDDSLFDDLFGEQPSPEIVRAILDNATEDPDVEGVVLRLEDLSLGWGPAAELRASIERLRAADKKVVVHLDSGEDVDVFVASAADKVYLSPSGGLALDGLQVVMTYLGETLSRVGVTVHAVAAGDYKSAPRAFTADAPSPEELEVQNAILDGTYAALTTAVATGRGLTVDEVKAIVDLGGLTADEALEKKLVDGLAYEDELEDLIEALAGHPVRLEERLPEDETRYVRWDEPAQVALVPVLGDIRMGRSDPGLPGLVGISAGAEDVVQAIDDARRDPAVKAIVLRIDSPGGDALASDLIWRAVLRARDEKPVIASMGEVAASGGYYIAAGAKEIFAEPGTITGSIGVFTMFVDASGLADDLGVRTYELQRGARTGPTMFRGPSPDEAARVKEHVEDTYERFLDAVAKGRGMDKEKVRAVAGGRVWLGSEAKERGLVDATGGVVEALDRARALAELPKDEPVVLSVRTGKAGGMLGLGRFLLRAQRDGGAARVARGVAQVLGDPEDALSVLEQGSRPAARLPWRIRVE